MHIYIYIYIHILCRSVVLGFRLFLSITLGFFIFRASLLIFVSDSLSLFPLFISLFRSLSPVLLCNPSCSRVFGCQAPYVKSLRESWRVNRCLDPTSLLLAVIRICIEASWCLTLMYYTDVLHWCITHLRIYIEERPKTLGVSFHEFSRIRDLFSNSLCKKILILWRSLCSEVAKYGSTPASCCNTL